jgi:hypothetical protein
MSLVPSARGIARIVALLALLLAFGFGVLVGQGLSNQESAREVERLSQVPSRPTLHQRLDVIEQRLQAIEERLAR